MGLLDGILGNGLDDPRSQMIMGLAQGLLSDNGSRGFAAGLGNMQAVQQNQIKQKLLSAQLQNYQSEADQRAFNMELMRRKQDMLSKIFGGQTGGTSPGVSPSGSLGTPPPAAGPSNNQPPSQGGVSGMSLDQIAQLKALGGIDLMDAWKFDKTPIVNRGFGIGTMKNGQYVPDQASTDQALALTQGKQNITAPFEPPITIDLSGGQKAQLSRPEYAAFQKTSQLPARYQQGGQSDSSMPGPAVPGLTNQGNAKVTPELMQFIQQDAQANGFSNPTMNFNAPKAGQTLGLSRTGGAPAQTGLGVPGLSQSQPDQIQQAGDFAQAKKYGGERGQQLAERPVATLAFNDAASNLDRLSAIAQEVANHPGLSGTSGLMGVFPNIPGSNASNAASKLETLKSQAAFSVLQAMRNASKTGGALGQVSDREEQMLANNLAALQKAQSPEELKNSLLSISAWADGAKSRMKNAYDMTYNGSSAGAPAGDQPDAPGSSLTRKASPPPVPMKGMVRGGYKFNGGDPSNQSSWEKQ